MKYDYLVVGAGPFGAVFAHEAHKRGKSVLVIDRRNHIAGNLYCESKDDINIHVYGAHIFHTSLKHVWDYVNQFAEFNHYVNSPVANYKGEMYNLPFNMNTFSKMWNILTPKEAQDIITKQRAAITSEPKNLEEQAISLVGPRPIVRDEIVKYGDYINDFYLVPPGITGVWQVSGRSDTTYEERVLMDSWYVHNWSVWIDIVYLLKTVLAVVKSKGAY